MSLWKRLDEYCLQSPDGNGRITKANLGAVIRYTLWRRIDGKWVMGETTVAVEGDNDKMRIRLVTELQDTYERDIADPTHPG